MELKAISCITGAVLINLTLGTFYSIGNVFPYIASYMRNHGSPNASSEDGMWVTAAFLLGQGVFLIVGSELEQLFGNRVACILGCTLHCISTFMTMYALESGMFVVILLYGFGCGMGCGSSYMASIIAAQKWYPQNKGLFTGLIVAGFGFGGLIFTTLQTMYLNPDNVEADSNGYFPEAVYNRVPNLFLYMGSIFAVTQAVGCILAFPPPAHPEESTNQIGNNGTQVVDQALPTMRSITSAFKYRIFYIIGLMMMLVAPGVTFVNSLGKRYGQVFIKDDKFLALVIAMAAVANASGRLFWGYLMDKFSFSTCFTVKVILFATLISTFPLEFVLSSKIIYFMWMLGLFFGFSGTFVLFPVMVEQVFGAKYNGTVYGILYIALAVSSILTSVSIGVNLNIGESVTARLVPCLIIAILYICALGIYRIGVSVDRLENAVKKRKDLIYSTSKQCLSSRKDLTPLEGGPRENSLGSIVRFADR